MAACKVCRYTIQLDSLRQLQMGGVHTCCGHHALQGLPCFGQHSWGQALPSGQEHATQGCQVCLLYGRICSLGVVDEVSGQLVHSHAHASQLTQVFSCALPHLASLQQYIMIVCWYRMGFSCVQLWWTDAISS